MGFLKQNSGNSIFLEIDSEQNKKRIRPLIAEPTMFWGHKIQSPEVAVTLSTRETKTLRLRGFHWEICTSINKKGHGCFLHNTTDPGWQYLAPRDQTNKKGQRTDFPMGRKILLPVWSYADQCVKILDGGNQIYEEMDKFFDLGKNIMDCDWIVWKTGEKKNTTYKSAREDAATFTVQVSQADVKAALEEAIGERYTALALPELQQKILCSSPEQARETFEKESAAKLTGGAPASAALPAGPARLALTTGEENLTDQEKMLKAALPHLSIEQVRAMIGGSTTTAPGGGNSGNFQVAPPANPVAQVVAQPQVAPVPVVQSSTIVPATYDTYTLSQGKYEGQLLTSVAITDLKYVQYLRSQGYDDTVKKFAAHILDTKPAMPEAVQTVPATPAPVSAPVTTSAGDVVATPQPVAAGGDASEDERKAVAAECNGLIKKIDEFKGLGMSKNLIPMLKQINARKFDYNQWSMGELQTLKTRLLAKTGHNPINPAISA